MAIKVVSAKIADNGDEIILTFSDGEEQSEELYYPEGEVVQIDGGVTRHVPDSDEWEIIDRELERFSKEVLGISRNESLDDLARDWVIKNIVSVDGIDADNLHVVESLTELLKSVANR